jgi:hypothetical protein
MLVSYTLPYVGVLLFGGLIHYLGQWALGSRVDWLTKDCIGICILINLGSFEIDVSGVTTVDVT